MGWRCRNGALFPQDFENLETERKVLIAMSKQFRSRKYSGSDLPSNKKDGDTQREAVLI